MSEPKRKPEPEAKPEEKPKQPERERFTIAPLEAPQPEGEK